MFVPKFMNLTKFSKILDKQAIVRIGRSLTVSRKYSNVPENPTDAEIPVEIDDVDVPVGLGVRSNDVLTEIPDFGNIIADAIDEHSRKPDIVNIDIDDMMEQDRDFGSTLGINENSKIIKSLDISGAPIAPVDVNPWMDELDHVEGTVNMETLTKPEIEYPPIPENRVNDFQFTGIRIKLPMRMLKPATYRYRMDEEDQNMADDMHICKY